MAQAATTLRVVDYRRVEDPRSLAAGGGEITLLGDLKAATAVGNSVTLDEIINISGYSTIAVIGKFSTVAGDPQLTITPMSEDGATEVTAKAPSDVTISRRSIERISPAAAQKVIEYTSEGDLLIKVAVECDANDTATVDWLRVIGGRAAA